ncbi:unnamed protein product, partial [Closterium sp. NIES-53]
MILHLTVRKGAETPTPWGSQELPQTRTLHFILEISQFAVRPSLFKLDKLDKAASTHPLIFDLEFRRKKSRNTADTTNLLQSKLSSSDGSGADGVAKKEEETQNTGTPSGSLKRKRNLPGNPDPDAEVVALSPRTLLATNRFVCEICNKGFQRDQNLQLHRRGHNLPWKLRQRTTQEVRKKVYVCPEPTCIHHDPSRALGDLTGIKKHFCRKHGEKKYKCEKCSKKYAVQSDWKAHMKTCGTREYRCDCGTLFS